LECVGDPYAIENTFKVKANNPTLNVPRFTMKKAPRHAEGLFS
jgi:hypothetical protein